MTVPVDFEGQQRRALREAARLAGISVVQFVHEPAAALYAWLRNRPDFRDELARLEGRFMLVFDWGGGTLDLTLCKIQGGTIVQIASDGDNAIGGDEFDQRLRNHVRDRFARENGIDDLIRDERPGMGAKLLAQCEQAKIALSADGTTERDLIVRDYLRASASSGDLLASVTRADLESVARPLVHRGLELIDRLLEEARVDREGIECCLPTGGMVNMPMIRNGLTERFGSRVPTIANGDRIISEGAAWIAHDATRISLAKPIEVRVADGSWEGRHHVLVPADFQLPVEGQTASVTNEQFVCADPRNGVAVFEFARPRGDLQPRAGEERVTLGTVALPVDPNVKPLVERLRCRLSIDADYIAHVELHSTGRGATESAEFHRLDFGLALPYRPSPPPDDKGGRSEDPRGRSFAPAALSRRAPPPRRSGTGSTVAFRVNIARAQDDDNRQVVAGDLAWELWPGMFDARLPDASPRQREEQMYYRSCAFCGRSAYEIARNGRVEACPGACRIEWSATRDEAPARHNG